MPLLSEKDKIELVGKCYRNMPASFTDQRSLDALVNTLRANIPLWNLLSASEFAQCFLENHLAYLVNHVDELSSASMCAILHDAIMHQFTQSIKCFKTVYRTASLDVSQLDDAQIIEKYKYLYAILGELAYRRIGVRGPLYLDSVNWRGIFKRFGYNNDALSGCSSSVAHADVPLGFKASYVIARQLQALDIIQHTLSLLSRRNHARIICPGSPVSFNHDLYVAYFYAYRQSIICKHAEWVRGLDQHRSILKLKSSILFYLFFLKQNNNAHAIQMVFDKLLTVFAKSFSKTFASLHRQENSVVDQDAEHGFIPEYTVLILQCVDVIGGSAELGHEIRESVAQIISFINQHAVEYNASEIHALSCLRHIQGLDLYVCLDAKIQEALTVGYQFHAAYHSSTGRLSLELPLNSSPERPRPTIKRLSELACLVSLASLFAGNEVVKYDEDEECVSIAPSKGNEPGSVSRHLLSFLPGQSKLQQPSTDDKQVIKGACIVQ